MLYLLLLVACFCQSNAFEDRNSEELLRDVFAYLEEQTELQDVFDIEDDDILDGITRLFRDHGFDDSDLLEDGLLSGIWNIISPGDKKKTFQAYNLAYQIGCYQGRSRGFMSTALHAWKKYQEYGCYCGSGYSYGKPLDATDRCCKSHDECFNKAQKDFSISSNCQVFSTQYITTCCRTSNITKCGDGGPSVGRRFCECDQAMAKCVAEKTTRLSYRVKNKNARRTSKCRVPGKHPTTMRMAETLKSCTKIRRVNNPPQKYGGQGGCPKRNRRRRGWWR